MCLGTYRADIILQSGFSMLTYSKSPTLVPDQDMFRAIQESRVSQVLIGNNQPRIINNRPL